MKKSLLFAMALGLAFSACSKEEVPLYDTENANFIEFVGASEDTTAFSFMFHPEVAAGGTYDLAIPVKILGLAKDKDRTYTVTVVDTLTTAEAGKHFTMPETTVFRAGMYEDTDNLLVVGVSDGSEVKSDGVNSEVTRALYFNVPLISHEVCHYTALRDFMALK